EVSADRVGDVRRSQGRAPGAVREPPVGQPREREGRGVGRRVVHELNGGGGHRLAGGGVLEQQVAGLQRRGDAGREPDDEFVGGGRVVKGRGDDRQRRRRGVRRGRR